MFFATQLYQTRWFHAIFMPVIIEFSRYISTYSSAKFELIISVLCASGVDFAIVSVVNALLEPGIAAIMCGTLILFICSLLTFALSYLLTAKIFKKKEY